VTFGGLGDGRSWLNFWPRKRTNYPLLWDRQMKPKPAFDAVLAAARDSM
jgi:endo-1,4-beta-xylanase